MTTLLLRGGVVHTRAGEAGATALAAEDGRIVFDGIFPQNSLRENAMNYRFAIPGGGAGLFDSGVEGVVWYGAYEDRLRGLKRASVLDRCLPTRT